MTVVANRYDPKESKGQLPVVEEHPGGNQDNADDRGEELWNCVREEGFQHVTILHHRSGEIRKILFSEESQRQFTQLLGNANTTVGTLGIDFRVGALVLYHRNHKEYRHKTESRQHVVPEPVRRAVPGLDNRVQVIGDEQKDEDYRQHQCQVEKKRSYNPFYKGLCPVFR